MWNPNYDELPIISRLQAPSSTVAKAPRDDFVKDFTSLHGIYEYDESPVHLFDFPNVTCGKVLNVYMWTVSKAGGDTHEVVALLFETV